MRFTIIKAILFTLLMLFLHFCGSHENETASNEIYFTIDSTLLGAELVFDEYKFSVHSPLGWDSLNTGLKDSIITRLQSPDGTSSIFYIQPLEIMFDAATSSVFATSLIRSSADSFNVQGYYSEVENRFERQSLKKGDFLKDKMAFRQYLIQSPSQVAFKLITETGNKNYLQFDYIIPSNHYMEQIKAIESSIGSIHQRP